MKTHMKSWLLVLATLVATGILVGGSAGRAEAQDYPWCAHLSVGDESLNCGFVTLDQCKATVSGIGGFCAPNTTYRGPAWTSAPGHWARRHYANQRS